MLRDPAFDGDRLDEEGRVVVLVAGRQCTYSRRFAPVFDEWDPPAGVRKAVATVAMLRDPLWDDLGLKVTPTLLLYADGRIVARRDGRPHEGLAEDDLGALARAAAE